MSAVARFLPPTFTTLIECCMATTLIYRIRKWETTVAWTLRCLYVYTQPGFTHGLLSPCRNLIALWIWTSIYDGQDSPGMVVGESVQLLILLFPWHSSLHAMMSKQKQADVELQSSNHRESANRANLSRLPREGSESTKSLVSSPLKHAC